jgi:hypothetical protein
MPASTRPTGRDVPSPKNRRAPAASEPPNIAYFGPFPNKRGSRLRKNYHIIQHIVRNLTGLTAVVALMLYYFTRHGGSG